MKAGYSFFDIQVTVTAQDIERLRTQPRENVPGVCRISGWPAFPVKLRLKGSGSFQPVDERPNLSVKPNRSIESLPELFHSKFRLHNSAQDSSLLRDMFARVIARRLNVPVPRLAYGRVILNGRDLGFYSICEAPDQPFLQRSFGDSEGSLFEGENCDIHKLSRAPVAWRAGQEETVERDSSTRLMHILDTFDRTNLWRFVALEYLSAHDDGLLVDLNNYFVYSPRDSGKCFLFPHTMDSAFRSDTPLVSMRSRSRLIQRLLTCEDDRRKILEILERATSDANIQYFLEILHYQSSTLLNDIAARNPDVARTYCFAMHRMSEKVKRHFDELRLALQIERGSLNSLTNFTHAESWKLKSIDAAGFSARDAMLKVRVSRASGTVSLTCPLVVRSPGAYKLAARVRCFPERPIVLEVGGSNSAFRVGPDWQVVQQTFEVFSSDSNGLFRVARPSATIQMRGFKGSLHLDAATIDLQPIRLSDRCSTFAGSD